MNYEKTIQDLEQQLKEYFAKFGIKKAIIGISGGIDSAVVAALCTRALGKENVWGILMPYENQNTGDARLLVNSLGINNKEINIKKIVDKFDFLDIGKITKGNIMTRVRMTILYTFANQFNGLVIGTGNKSEIEIGYFTKYGDGGVDLEPIGDLYKTEIIEIAKLLNIPEQIRNKRPSAELWEGQTDEDELGITYNQLDAILKGELNEETLKNKVEKRRKNSEHKKIMPPVFKVNREAEEGEKWNQ